MTFTLLPFVNVPSATSPFSWEAKKARIEAEPSDRMHECLLFASAFNSATCSPTSYPNGRPNKAVNALRSELIPLAFAPGTRKAYRHVSWPSAEPLRLTTTLPRTFALGTNEEQAQIPYNVRYDVLLQIKHMCGVHIPSLQGPPLFIFPRDVSNHAVQVDAAHAAAMALSALASMNAYEILLCI